MPDPVDTEQQPKPKRFGWKTGVSVLLVISTVLFASGELITRKLIRIEFEGTVAAFRGSFFVLKPEKDYEYLLQPNLSSAIAAPRGHPWTYRINEQGFRGPNFSPKAADEFRIVFLGDSFTFGWGVDQDKIFPVRMVEALNQLTANRTVKGVNLAVPGYNTEMELALLKEQIDQLAPDLVFLSYVYNDAEPQQAAPMKPERRYQFCSSWLLEQMKGGISGVIGGPLLESKKFEGTFDVMAGFESGSWKWPRSKQALGDLANLCQERGSRFYVAILPGFEASFADHPYQPIHEKVKIWCDEFAIAHSDLLPLVEGVESKPLMIEGDGHPNADGHALLAAKLLEQFPVRWIDSNPDRRTPGAPAR